MNTLLTRVQLAVFAVVTVLAVGYGAVNLLGVGSVLSPPYTVEAQFTAAGGITPRADVDLLGTKVGTVKSLRPGPGSGTTVVMALDKDVRISSDVTATIGSKSAIGEQYIDLKPLSSGGDVLREGDVIPLEATVAPIDFAQLLGHANGLAASLPAQDVATTLDELSVAFGGVGPTMGRLIEDADEVTRASLANVESINTMIDTASILLDTQVDLAPRTTSVLASLAPLSAEIARLAPTLGALFVEGVSAGAQITSLLRNVAGPLPALLANLLEVSQVASDGLPALRKTLTLFPWAVELLSTAVRPCDEYDAQGRPIAATCRYDDQGRPVISAHLAAVLPQPPGGPAYAVCTKGYEGTVKHLPDGTPVGGGPRQQQNSEPNLEAQCTASPTDPTSPSVRGSQNVQR